MHDNTETNTIEIDSLSKTYGDRRILSSIYLQIKTGDICALFGRNGTGKSTLQRIIFGSLRADYKFIRINGQFAKKPYTTSNYISYLSDAPFIPSHLNVKETLDLYGISPDTPDCIPSKSLDKRISELSSGERRFFEIYLILNKDAYFALLDEPFKFLSPLMIEQAKKLITAAAKKKGIVIADHRHKKVLDISNRILLIKDESLYELKDENELVEKGYLHL